MSSLIAYHVMWFVGLLGWARCWRELSDLPVANLVVFVLFGIWGTLLWA